MHSFNAVHTLHSALSVSACVLPHFEPVPSLSSALCFR